MVPNAHGFSKGFAWNLFVFCTTVCTTEASIRLNHITDVGYQTLASAGQLMALVAGVGGAVTATRSTVEQLRRGRIGIALKRKKVELPGPAWLPPEPEPPIVSDNSIPRVKVTDEWYDSSHSGAAPRPAIAGMGNYHEGWGKADTKRYREIQQRIVTTPGSRYP